MFGGTHNGVDTLLLRLVVGAVFFAHGAQKLFGWFGGYGLDGVAGWMDSVGLSPGYPLAVMAGSAEFFGGILLILGLLTRPAAAILALTMAVAVFWVHWSAGFFAMNNGYEYALVLMIASIALAISGGGRFALDRKILAKTCDCSSC
jgi:putative oxidoreductase